MPSVLRVKEVSKAFGGVIAAEKVSFEVQSAEIMGLIGPNGAGKTTLLNLVSGIYECDSGQIFLGKTEVTKTPAHKRARMGLARTFQTPRFLERAEIRDNLLLGVEQGDQVGFFKSFIGVKGTDFEKEVKILLDIAGFSIRWDDDISAMPFGQRKRLEIIRALLSHPKVMLVDEPAAGLNTKELESVMNLLKFALGKGVGVVLIEHRMDLVMNVCNRIIVLNFGKLIASGKPKEVATNPAVIEAYLGKDV